MDFRQRWWTACALSAFIGCSTAQPQAADDTGAPVDTGTEDTFVPPVDNPPTECPTDQTRCGDSCVDTRANNSNCGSCGNACTGTQTCTAGTCTDMMVTCPMGQTACGMTCVDTTADGMNCGSCGNACAMGQSCAAGTCSTPPMCPMGQTSCGGACVDTATDATHCGACSMACAASQSCTGGMCVSMMMCPMGQTLCAGTCADTQTDIGNCGACGTACPMGQSCTAGVCAMAMCPMGETLCGGACANTQTDTSNCGGCGRSCSAGQTCAAGTCTGAMTGCPMGQTMCGMACSELNSDPANCGRCGNACAAGQACTLGTCATMMTCPMGQTMCGAACVNTQTDTANCGGCGTDCGAGQTCTAGACACAMGQTLCGRACVNTQTDRTNCGMCGTACPMGQSCVSGRCSVTCPTGETLCSGMCANTQTDREHCGTCTTVCTMGQSCVSGRCACPMGQVACMGVCANTQTDRANCGMCGTACPMGQSCVSGRCACAMGQTVCMGRCVDTQTNAAHCGMCGTTCMSGQSCTAGRCAGMPPGNDTRAGATVINLATPSTSVVGNTTAARNDTTGSCGCTTGNDVFFRFALTQPEYVYADTLGAAFDTSLFFQNAAGTNLPAPAGSGQITCNDDRGLCATGAQSQVVARLAPGTYFLVLSGCGSGTATVHFQHLPAGNGTNSQIAPSSTVQTASGSTTGTGTTNATCCSGGPENSYWWVTCPSTAATSFQSTNCNAASRAFDTEIDQRSALRAAVSVCNDDTGFQCGTGSALSSTIPATTAAQAGLNTLVVDSCSGSGAYAVQYVLGNCSSGTRCGAACIDPQTDSAHCGGCNRACSAGQFCSAGSCTARPPNDTRTGATLVNLAQSSQLLPANTTGAVNDTRGTCACTGGNDVFYRFVLTRTELVYADTIGATWDTSLFFQNSAGTNLTSPGVTNGAVCTDDTGLTGCATGLQSQVLARLTAGTYFLVLSGCGRGAANIRFQHLPEGNDTSNFLRSGTSTIIGITVGTGTVTASCCSGGPEDTYFWYTCQGSTGGAFRASTCGRATWDTELDQRSAGRAGVSQCNDDSCGLQSNLSSTIPAGPGLHALYVDGCGSGNGIYTATVTRP